MDVTIIGTGNMARGIGARVVAGGHGLTVLGRERAEAEALAAELGGGARAGEVGEPAESDLVVLAVPYEAAADLARRYDGATIVDITNPVDFSSFEPIHPGAGSAAEEIQAAAPGARVVKAFNTTFAGTLAEGAVAGQPLDVLIAGDDEEAKGRVARLARDGGMTPRDAGPLRRARELEAAGYLHMALTQGTEAPFGTALRVVA
ncbi:NADPH-dependent F420 reductase [Miltoncostaea marina]|uniref:NADPH-dependent F420 reductase n=1 Tax=Miltoncostaea marina TaxID=2843215 RepID=UPI001C3E32F9|nr:NAD(P)-binding domain-containing protein [Miltoncostaea marina]